MTTQIRTTVVRLAGVLLMSAVLPGTALAVDGQVAITQAKALAGGVTPGDVPGFPVSINLPGSYVLSSGLTVPDSDTTAIEINADHVTVDLNGFAILGPTDCSGGNRPCANAGAGSGISTPDVRFNITIRGGTIQGMGGVGVSLRGDSHLVEYLNIRSNGSSGVSVNGSADRGGSVVQHNNVQRNGGFGILVTVATVADNTVNTNGFTGIYVSDGLVLHNVVSRNGFGMTLDSHAIYVGNVIFENAGGSQVGGGQNGGQNLCGFVTCPGASF